MLADTGTDRLALPIDAALGLQTMPEWRAGSELLGDVMTVPDPAGTGELKVRPLNPQVLLGRLHAHLGRL